MKFTSIVRPLLKRRFILIPGLIATTLVISSCASGGGIAGALGDATSVITGRTSAGTEVSGRSTNSSDYSGNRASMAVLRFVDATGGRASNYRWYSKETGDAMARKLTSALLSTKRFQMVQRQNIDDLMNEINFGASGAVASGSAAQFGNMVGAQLVVTASITDFEDAGGSKGGAASGSGGLLGGLAGALKKTYMAINLEVVDVSTSEIIASEQIDATIRDVSVGAVAGLGGSGAAGGLSGWDKEPKGKALQKIINSATEYLSESIPERYYTKPPS
jgi:curli biogenesis system outer membrane secretion channel CsgG